MAFKVLIVDDDYINRLLLISLLKKELYQVEILESSNGEEALKICHEHSNIQLILLDIEMPRMDGVEFLIQYKLNTTLPQIPTIAVSSNDLRIKEIRSAGADAFIIKPVSEEKLLKAIRETQRT